MRDLPPVNFADRWTAARMTAAYHAVGGMDPDASDATIRNWWVENAGAQATTAGPAEADGRNAAAQHVATMTLRASESAAVAALAARREGDEIAERHRVTAEAALQANGIAEWEAERAAAGKATADAATALVRQDTDIRAVAFYITFSVAGPGDTWTPLDDCSDPADWADAALSDTGSELGEPLGDLAARRVLDQVREALAPWASHFAALGLPRADNLASHLMGDTEGATGSMTFYLVHRPADGSDHAEPGALVEFPTVVVPLNGVPGFVLTVQGSSAAINATRLYEAMRDVAPDVGSWGGEATPDLYPEAGEDRGHWLARVCVPAARVARLTSRWERCGGNLDLFGVFGSASERSVEDRPIEFAIPGLFPLGYVSLLVGTKQAGKSTLLGEAAAVIDSECFSTRTFLGADVSKRGASGIVSGEDGDDIVNARAMYYESVHGESCGFVIDIAHHPWPKTLALLHKIPDLVFLGIDPLRAILPGDEDASNGISQLFDELNTLAREKHCAIVLAHHLGKSVPKSLSAMLPAVRGSSAITDRPRVVVGMIDRGNSITEVGIIKCNLPPSVARWGEVNVGRLFRRDAATLTLVPIDDARAMAAAAQTGSDATSIVLAAVKRENALRAVLRRTGKSELFERKLPQLAGFSRQTIRDGVTALISTGELQDGFDGLQAGPPTTPDSEAA